jgi:hypothetical protein
MKTSGCPEGVLIFGGDVQPANMVAAAEAIAIRSKTFFIPLSLCHKPATTGALPLM